jgi:hypothetical protein
MKNTYPKTLQEVYNEKKKCIDTAYLEMYHMIEDEIENDEEYSLDSDSLNELVVDLMLSNVLGTITTFDHVHECLKFDIEERDNLAEENKNMALALQKLNYTPEQISDICNGAI